MASVRRRAKGLAVTGTLIAGSALACLALFGTGSSALSSPAQTAATGVPDLTKLPLGDGKSSTTTPARGYLFTCGGPGGMPGAQVDGPWIHGSTYDLTAKSTVDGAVDWPNARFKAKIKRKVLRLRGNGLPKHTTGVFPISPSDDAYQVDRNPNSIKAYTLAEKLSAKPKRARRASCTGGGMIGVMRSGVALFNAVDAGGKDAVAHEVQDSCSGHPQQQGQYHYHGLPACINTGPAGKQSQVIGWALDGFPITGPLGAKGAYLGNDKLDVCHGTTSKITYFGKKLRLYHYVANYEFPYTVGCFRGTPVSTGGP
jgi:hypothetical protein